jgi:predicted amidohydrolase
MPRKLIGGLIQAAAPITDPSTTIEKIRKAAIDALWSDTAEAVPGPTTKALWNIGRFHGSSYFVDPRGNFLAVGSDERDELIVAETYGSMVEQFP